LVRLNVHALDAGGHGIARNAEGKVVFVEGALGGETVEARLVRSKPKFDQARAVRILHAASGRRAPPCPWYENCGGCVIQHADARTQVAAKQRWLEDCLERIGKVAPGSMLAPIYGPEWGYRHRARLSVRYVEKKGGALVGFRERRSTYVVDMQSCEVLTPRVSALIVPPERCRGLSSVAAVADRGRGRRQGRGARDPAPDAIRGGQALLGLRRGTRPSGCSPRARHARRFTRRRRAVLRPAGVRRAIRFR
jgi:23S rRNA (uracil1939-C5)-methyltransferase